MALLTPWAKQAFFDANGDPLASGKLYTYEAGTTTPLATYTNSTGVTANANPIILDARGECSVWIDSSAAYKFVLKDSSDVTIWTIDQISADAGASTARGYSNYAALRAVEGSGDLVALVAGRSTDNDGGGGMFAWSSASSATDDDGTILTPDSAPASGRWLRVYTAGEWDVRWFGATGDGSTDDTASINAAATAIASTGGTLIFPKGAYKLTASVTVGSTTKPITLRFNQGAQITAGSAYYFTFSGDIESPDQQIFAANITPLIANATTHRPKRVVPQWFGATGDGTTDDTAALQRFFTFLKTHSGRGFIPRPANFYSTTSKISMTESSSVHIDCEAPVDTFGSSAVQYFKRTATGTAVSASGVRLVTGSETGTYTNTASDDTSYHQITLVSGALDLVYTFSTGAATNYARTLDVTVKLQAGAEVLDFYAYPWTATTTVNDGSISSGDTTIQLSSDGLQVDDVISFANVNTTDGTKPRQFKITSASDNIYTISPAMISTGGSQNIDALPANGANVYRWVRLGRIKSAASPDFQTATFQLPTSVTGTGGDAGQVRIGMFAAASELASTDVYVDYLKLTHYVSTVCDDMFDFTGSKRLRISNLSLWGGYACNAGLRLEGNASHRVINTEFNSLVIGGCEYGLVIGDTSSYQWSEGTFTNCWLSANRVNVAVYGANTEQLNFHGGQLNGATYGVLMSNGGANFYGVGFTDNFLADIFVENSLSVGLSLYSCYSENAGACFFLDTIRTTGAYRRSIVMIGCIVLHSATFANAGLAAQPTCVRHRNNMSLSCIGNRMAGGIAPRIPSGGSYGKVVILDIGNDYGTYNGINPTLALGGAADQGAALIQINSEKCVAVGSQQRHVYTGGGSDETFLPQWSGLLFSNAGYAGGATVNLPAATAGLQFTIVRNAAFALYVNPSGSEVIRGGGAGKYLQLGSDGANVTLVCVVAGTWEILASYGTITYEP